MAIALRFNGQKFYDDLKEELKKTMKQLIDEFYRAATSGMSAGAKADSDNLGVIEDELEHQIEAQCAFYADAIMESFGTGSKMDKNNKYFDEYRRSGLYNLFRGSYPGRPILGRGPKYTNIFGDTIKTTGRNNGKNLEHLDFIWNEELGEYVKFDVKSPTYAIQNTEVWLMQNRETSMERAIKQTVIAFIEQVNANPLEYFYYVEV